MQIREINTVEEFENLKRGDMLLIEWSDYFVKHHPKSKKIELYSIYKVYPNNHEVICRMKDNHYFNYNLYLDNKSCAVKVLRVLKE